jgi:putative inorganic carbon (HCO3(-)) transporter
MVNIISYLFYGLLFFTPLVMNTYTSEIFEFNKIVFLYLSTTLIITAWIVRMITEKRFIFRRTLLDIPLLVFIGSQGISTILSIDFRTSLLGYYSRFNGGFISILCYALLYWAWVSNISRRQTLIAFRLSLIASLPVCLYGIAQHFGIDKDIWVQDVQNRIFSTLGQPNWLAAWICGIAPLAWAQMLNAKSQMLNKDKKKYWTFVICHLSLAIFLFITLLYTKSRSGLLAFGTESIIFWSFTLFKNWKMEPGKWKLSMILNSLFLILIVVIGSPWNKSIIVSKSSVPEVQSTTTSLESGGTESGEIRKIVWQGAFDIFKRYPIFGTGVETFAFAYYQFKPEAHNYTSEWDYLYNKAHNEYLNYLATTGVVGLISYLVLIIFSLYQIVKNSKTPRSQNSKQDKSQKLENLNLLGDLEFLSFGVFAGYVSILVTNFFGFSVVPVSLLFFLFPAFAFSLSNDSQSQISNKTPLNLQQKGLILFVICNLLFVISRIAGYYSADLAYASGRQANRAKDVITAQKKLIESTEKEPNEALFWDELALSTKQIAIALAESKQIDKGKKYAQDAITESKTAIDLSPRNINLKRNYASTLTALSSYDQSYLSEALNVLKEGVQYAPTDPKLQYALAASYYRLGQLDQAIVEMKKAVDMKKDYKDSHYALALMYEDAKQNDKAREEYRYILEKIDGKDEQVGKELQQLNEEK